MNKNKLKKEALISLWNRVCKENADKNSFSTAGSDDSPYYLLNVDENIMSTISATQTGSAGKEKSYEYKINVIFGEFVEYSSFKLDKSEFNALADLFVKHQNEAINKEVNRIVEDTEERFLSLVSDGKV
tara:strand:+ start:10813 stop:11199 length:387 start_codon:yes stop_codon:yes gene_type:complete